MRTRNALRRRHAADVYEAFRQVCLLNDVPTLASRMGLRPGTLYNKVEAGDDSHNQPTLRDVVQVTELTGDMGIVEALASTFGHALFDCRTASRASDEELLTLLADMGAETGQFHAALAEGLRDRRFSRAHLHTIRGEGLDIVAALMTLLARLEDLVDGDANAAMPTGATEGAAPGARHA